MIIFFNSKEYSKDTKLKIFYGGSKGGDIGGPLVKFKKLKKSFPNHYKSFNTVYLISNNSYLNRNSLKILKERKIPIILNQNGVFYPSWYKGDYLKKNLELSYAYHLANYVFWQSKFCKKASDKFLGKRTGNGEILYNAVDTSIFIPKYKNKKYFSFLITGNINKFNNYRVLSVIQAMREIHKLDKSVRLIIAGNIEDRNYFELISSQMKLTNIISFIGRFNQKEAAHIYQLADAYITMTYQDNCPSAVIEAMASGLPILYSSSGGVPELVDEGSGIGLSVSENWEKIKVPEKKEIIKGMQEIIQRKEMMSVNARKRALDKFDQTNWLKKQKIIFEKYLKNN